MPADPSAIAGHASGCGRIPGFVPNCGQQPDICHRTACCPARLGFAVRLAWCDLTVTGLVRIWPRLWRSAEMARLTLWHDAAAGGRVPVATWTVGRVVEGVVVQTHRCGPSVRRGPGARCGGRPPFGGGVFWGTQIPHPLVQITDCGVRSWGDRSCGCADDVPHLAWGNVQATSQAGGWMTHGDQGLQAPPRPSGIPPGDQTFQPLRGDCEQPRRLQRANAPREAMPFGRCAVLQPIDGHWADASRAGDRVITGPSHLQPPDMVADGSGIGPRLPSAVGDLAGTPPGVVLVRRQARLCRGR